MKTLAPEEKRETQETQKTCEPSKASMGYGVFKTPGVDIRVDQLAARLIVLLLKVTPAARNLNCHPGRPDTQL